MILVTVRVISLDEVTKPFRIFIKIFILLISCHMNPGLFGQSWRRNRRNNASRMRCFR